MGHEGQPFRLARLLGEDPGGCPPRLLGGRPADGKRSGCNAVVCIANCDGAGALRSRPYAVALPSTADRGVTSGGDFTF